LATVQKRVKEIIMTALKWTHSRSGGGGRLLPQRSPVTELNVRSDLDLARRKKPSQPTMKGRSFAVPSGGGHVSITFRGGREVVGHPEPTVRQATFCFTRLEGPIWGKEVASVLSPGEEGVKRVGVFDTPLRGLWFTSKRRQDLLNHDSRHRGPKRAGGSPTLKPLPADVLANKKETVRDASDRRTTGNGGDGATAEGG